MTDKALALCVRYSVLAREIRNATRILRDTQCPHMEPSESPDWDHNFPGNPGFPSCLDDFFGAPKGPDGEFPRRAEFLAKLCDNCKIKLAAIEHRKELRREMGCTKRGIERIGVKASLAEEKGCGDQDKRKRKAWEGQWSTRNAEQFKPTGEDAGAPDVPEREACTK